MGSLGDYLMEELSLKTSFTIPIGGGIPVPQSAVTTWVIMAIVVLLCIIFVRNLKVIPEGPQVYVEALVGFIYNFIGGLVGEKGKRYIPFLGTILIYLGCANISGFFRAKPPTKDLNVTAGLAIITMQRGSVRKRSMRPSLDPGSSVSPERTPPRMITGFKSARRRSISSMV